MSTALDRPDLGDLFAHWTVQPVAIALVALLAFGYWRGLRALRRSPRPGPLWPAWRTGVFGFGLVVLLWASCGIGQVYARSLYWMWTAQTLVLWLLVPIIVLLGHPIQLAQRVLGPGSVVDRVLAAKPVRVLGNPLVGPALVPILCFALFFGPFPRWAVTSDATGWLSQLALLLVGAGMVLSLVGLEESASSLAVGFSLAIGSFELVLDAVPGIALRLHNSLVTSYFEHRLAHPWAPHPLRDQQIGGGILWCMAELIDLPFLALVFRRWLRADARDAAHVDAVLAAERAARRALVNPADDAAQDEQAERDTPWWLSDPAMQQRLRRHR